MNEHGFSIVTKAVQSANEGGNLTVTGVWALFCFVLLAYIVYRERLAKASTEEWQRIRTEEAKADMIMGTAFNRMVDEIMKIKIILDERSRS